MFTENQVGAKESLDLSNKKDELKQIESIFSQNLMDDLICAKLNIEWKMSKHRVFSGPYLLHLD